MIIPVTAGVIFNDEDDILITQRRVGDRLAGKWEFPGGKIQEGESPEACLVREIREELDIEIEVEELLHAVNHHYPHEDVLLLAYLCRFVNGSIRLNAHSDYKWIEAKCLSEMNLADADMLIVRRLIERCAIGGIRDGRKEDC
jgi:8-oxo-dGTP diphosphatase